jgi:uncharacterized Tic20 family protein
MSYQPDQSTAPPGNVPPVPAVPSSDERSMAMLAHLSSFAGCLLPLLGHIGGPLIVLLIRGDSSPFVSYHAREALNFNISLFIWSLVAGVLCVVLIGFALLAFLFIAWVVLTIIAALKARDGLGYRYPFTLRLIPER